MLTSERDKQICKKYGERDKNGFVHCSECPLVIDESQLLCKANSHYDRHLKDRVLD